MHAFGIVLVKDSEDVGAEVARLLAPFSECSPEYEAQFDADGEELAGYVPGAFWWDWYRIGGRWDGLVRGLAYESAPGCACSVSGWGIRLAGASADCHYGQTHDTLKRNSILVSEMGEVRPFTLVTPEGEVRHREKWVSDPTQELARFPWRRMDDEGYDRWCGEQLLAHRDCLAIGIDYHD